MSFIQTALTALHWLGVAVYFGSFVFLIVIFQNIYRRYQSYKYVDNFRAEVITLYWKFLHGSFALIVVSGAGLTGLAGKSVLHGVYGLMFSAKLALWLVQIYLSQELLKPFAPELHASDKAELPRESGPRDYAVVVLLLLIALAGFSLKFL